MTIEFNREEFRLIPDISSNVSSVDVEGNSFKLIPVMSFDTNNRPLAGLLNKGMNQLEFYRLNAKGTAWKFQKSFMLYSEPKIKPKRFRKKAVPVTETTVGDLPSSESGVQSEVIEAEPEPEPVKVKELPKGADKKPKPLTKKEKKKKKQNKRKQDKKKS